MAQNNKTSDITAFLKKFLVLAIIIFVFVIIYFIAIYPIAKNELLKRMMPLSSSQNEIAMDYAIGKGGGIDMMYDSTILATTPIGGSVKSSTENPQIIKTANLDIQVKEITSSVSQISDLADNNDGYVQYSNIYEDNIGKKYANITILIPQTKLTEILNQIKALAIKVINENTNNNDVTQQSLDLASQIESLKAIEKQYLALLEKAKTVDEIINVQDRLNSTQRELASYEKQLEYLSNQVTYSSVYVSLTEQESLTVPANKFDLNETFRGAIKTLITILQNFLVFVIVLFFVLIGLIPYILLILAIAWVVKKIIDKNKRKKK